MNLVILRTQPSLLLCITWPLQSYFRMSYFFFPAEDGIRDYKVTGVQTCALPIFLHLRFQQAANSLLQRNDIGGHHFFLQILDVSLGVDERPAPHAIVELAYGRVGPLRSEERRVGKECRWRGTGSAEQK